MEKNFIYYLMITTLVFVVIFSYNSTNINKYTRRFYVRSVCSSIAILLGFAVRNISRAYDIRWLHIATNVVVYALPLFIPYFLCAMHFAQNKKLQIILALPCIVIALIAVSSVWTGLLFHVSKTNAYTRGVLYYVSFVIITVYFFVCLGLNIRTYRDAERPEKIWVASIFLLNLPAGIIQTVNAGIYALWTTCAASLVLYFIFISEMAANYDVLTNVRNRNSFYAKKSKLTTDTAYSVMIYDINHLKKANDNIGHAVGDVLIMDAAKILSKAFHKIGTPFRIGGDEFCVILNITEEDKLSEINKKIMKILGEYNETSDLLLSISFGHEIHHPQDKRVFEEIFEAADANMYKMKNEHRRHF